MQVNPAQRRAIEYIDGPLLVVAGAGSGKTRVITRKIIHLIRGCGLKANAIAAVTFTNKAAREMKNRVEKELEGPEYRGLRVSTFHTLGLNILKSECVHAGLKPGFSILDAQDSRSILMDLLEGTNADTDDIERISMQISQWKSGGELSDPSTQELDQATLSALELYHRYSKTLLAYNAVDFDDLIAHPCRVLQSIPEVRERWQTRIRYILVDEYQDTNHAQYELLRQLVGVTGAMTAVGDDDQSIYAWRGARPENIQQLKSDYPNLEVVKLEQNYRSTGRILRSANRLIENNPRTIHKALWSEHGPGEKIRIIQCKNELEEARRVVSEITSHRFKWRTNFRDYAVLYRGNHQSRVFEKVMREQSVPYFLSGGTSFFARSEIKDIMGYLRLLVNPDDDVAFRRVVNTPKREIGATTLERLSGYASERAISLFSACFEMGLAHCLGDRPRQRLERFSTWIREFRAGMKEGDESDAVRKLVSEIDYEQWLIDQHADPKTAQRRMNNVWELIDWLDRIQSNAEDARSFEEGVSHLCLMDILEREDEENDLDRVTLSTLHAAKGLEFSYVFIVGSEENLLPHHASLDETAIEEERRLTYVGMTRAMKTLSFTMSVFRSRYQEKSETEPSRFLFELPQDDVDWEGFGQEANPEESRQKGVAHLESLKGILS